MRDRREKIDWEALSCEVDLINETVTMRIESAGTTYARAALECIVGPDAIRSSVDDYVAGHAGGELARSVLWLLRPPSAMERCYEIYQDAPDLESKRSAIELLRVVADQRALVWVSRFLADADPDIQIWGIGIVDQLIFSRIVSLDECESVLALAEVHSSQQVREKAQSIREYAEQGAE